MWTMMRSVIDVFWFFFLGLADQDGPDVERLIDETCRTDAPTPASASATDWDFSSALFMAMTIVTTIGEWRRSQSRVRHPIKRLSHSLSLSRRRRDALPPPPTPRRRSISGFSPRRRRPILLHLITSPPSTQRHKITKKNDKKKRHRPALFHGLDHQSRERIEREREREIWKRHRRDIFRNEWNPLLPSNIDRLSRADRSPPTWPTSS